MTREAKLGLLVILTAFATLWGYKFIKGKDLFSKSLELKTIYPDVTGLSVSSPVLVNGFKIGTVTSINLNPNNVKEMEVTMAVDNKFKIPKDAVAILFSESVVGGKSISIEFDAPCSDNNCLKDGSTIQSSSRGMLTSMLGSDNLDGYLETAGDKINETIESLGKDGQDGQVHQSIRNLNKTMESLAQLSANLNNMVVTNNKNMKSILSNVEIVTASLADNNKGITDMINNMSKITEDISKAKLGESTSQTMTEAKDAITQLNKTLETSQATMDNLGLVIEKINNNEGSLGKLINEKELYDNLEFTSKNLGLLLQDLRINPKRYVNVSIFGKGQKEYEVPDEDPAFKD